MATSHMEDPEDGPIKFINPSASTSAEGTILVFVLKNCPKCLHFAQSDFREFRGTSYLVGQQILFEGDSEILRLECF